MIEYQTTTDTTIKCGWEGDGMDATATSHAQKEQEEYIEQAIESTSDVCTPCSRGLGVDEFRSRRKKCNGERSGMVHVRVLDRSLVGGTGE